MTPADLRTLVYAFRNAPVKDIARRAGVSPRTVVRIRAELGISPKRKSAPTEATLQTAASLLESGCSIRETARTVGVSETTVRRHLPEYSGWTPEEAGRWAAVLRYHRQIERL